MKRILFLVATLGVVSCLGFSCDIVKQNNLFEVINKKPEFLVSIGVVGYRADECSAIANPPRQVNNEHSNLIASSGARSRFVRWELLSGGGHIGDTAAPSSTYTVAARNAELRAVFDRARYALTVQWDAVQGGVSGAGLGPAGSNVTVEDEIAYSLLASPLTVPYHYFTQWRVVSGQGVRFDDASDPSTAVTMTGGTDAVILAAFTAQPVSLSVSAGANGSVEPSGEALVAGMNDPFFIRAIPVAGATFHKWEILPNSGNATIDNPLSETTSVTCWSPDPVKVRAVFLRNQYPVSFVAEQGGTILVPGPGETLVEDGAALAIAASPLPGYLFTGWVADPAANASIENSMAISTEARFTGPATLTARFSPNSSAQISVSLTSPSIGGVIFSQTELSLARGATLMVAAADPAFAVLSGWSWFIDSVIIAGQTGPSLAYPTSSLDPGSYSVSAMVDYKGTRYAGSFKLTLTQGSPSGYRVIYRAGRADSGAPPYDPAVYGTTAVAQSNSGALAKAYHYFVGWNTQEDGAGVNYAAGQNIPIAGSDIVLYPRFAPNSYTLSVGYTMGGTSSSDSGYVLHGVPVPIWANAAPGWVFDHWSDMSLPGAGQVSFENATSASTTATLRFGHGSAIAYFLEKNPTPLNLRVLESHTTGESNQSTMNLSWVGSPQAEFLIEASVSPSFFPVAKLSSSNTMNLEVSGLAPGTRYYFRVRAIGDGKAPSDWSDSGTGVTLGWNAASAWSIPVLGPWIRSAPTKVMGSYTWSVYGTVIYAGGYTYYLYHQVGANPGYSFLTAYDSTMSQVQEWQPARMYCTDISLDPTTCDILFGFSWGGNITYNWSALNWLGM